MKKKPYSSTDYQAEMLPKNRKEVFKDVVKIHVRTLLLSSVVLFVFSLPLQISAYLKEITLSSIYRAYADGSISLEETTTSLRTLSNQFSILNIVFIIFFSIGLSGIIRIIKGLSWYEPIVFTPDFVKGIKDNGMQYSITFLIIGFLLFLTTAITNLSSIVEQSIVYEIMGILPKVVLIILFSPAVAYLLIIIAIYSNKLSHHFRLSLFLFMSSVLYTIKNMIILSLPFFILLIPNFYVHIISRILLVILVPFILLKWFLLASDILDQKWNIKHYPELMYKGIIGLNRQENEGIKHESI